MTVADDIAAFVASNLSSVVSAIDLSAARAVYIGQQKSNIRRGASVNIALSKDVDINRALGKVRHSFTLTIHKYGIDKQKEEAKSDLVITAAKEVEDAYDGAISTFNAGVSSAEISRVRCYRKQGVDNLVRGSSRDQEITLEVDWWE